MEWTAVPVVHVPADQWARMNDELKKAQDKVASLEVSLRASNCRAFDAPVHCPADQPCVLHRWMRAKDDVEAMKKVVAGLQQETADLKEFYEKAYPMEKN